MSKIILNTETAWTISCSEGWVLGLPMSGTGYFEYTPTLEDNTSAAREAIINISYETSPVTVDQIPIHQAGVGNYISNRFFILGLDEDSSYPVKIITEILGSVNSYFPVCNTILDTSNYMGSETIPPDGEKLRLTLCDRGDMDGGYKPFLHQLNNAYFLQSNTNYDNATDVLNNGAVALSLTDDGTNGYYDNATFIADYKYSYFVLDYRNVISDTDIDLDNLSAAFTTNFKVGYDYGEELLFNQVSINPYGENCVKEIRYNGSEIFKEESNTSSDVNVITTDKDNQFSILSLTPTAGNVFNFWTPHISSYSTLFESITISGTPREYYYDCLGDVATVNYRHSNNLVMGYLPIGTKLFDISTFGEISIIGGWYTDEINAYRIDESGVITDWKVLSCSEAGIPVITSEVFTVERGISTEFKVIATNKPYKYSLKSTYESVLVKGGVTGGIWSYLDAHGNTKTVSVSANTELFVIGDYTTFANVRGSGSTISNNGVFTECGASITDDGILKVNSAIGGTFSITITATNCVGVSADTTMIFTVANPSLLYKFTIDYNGQCDETAACALTPPETTLWFDGQDHCTWPALNNYIYTDSDGNIPFNGGYLWYLTGNNQSILIDSTGCVIETSAC